jgi:Phage integrase family
LYAPIPVVLAGTGLRPEELYGLEWRDVDRRDGVLSVERVYTQNVLKPCKKSDRQRRRVPLRARVLEALEQRPRGFGETPVFTDRRGDRIKHVTFRMRHWAPALKAAGLDHRGVYATRHVRDVVDPRWGQPVLLVACPENLNRHDRQDLRSPCARLGRVPARPARHLRCRRGEGRERPIAAPPDRRLVGAVNGS